MVTEGELRRFLIALLLACVFCAVAGHVLLGVERDALAPPQEWAWSELP